MTAFLALRSMRNGKARFACAAAGIAAAVGALVFSFSLAATNAAQGPELARRASIPWAAWGFSGDASGDGPGDGLPAAGMSMETVSLTIDLRPDGHVLQGPPMRAVLAKAPSGGSPWGSAPLESGAWPDDSSPEPQIACTPLTLRRFGRGKVPPTGSRVKFVGRRGTVTAAICGYLADSKLPPGWPTVFANKAARDALSEEPVSTLSLWPEIPAGDSPGVLVPESGFVARSFAGEENRRMDYARPLLLAAAVLTALALLCNSLLLSVEANRRSLAILRTVGLSRGGVVRISAVESFFSAFAGWICGTALAALALELYVAADPETFPVGAVVSWRAAFATGALVLPVGALALAFALRPALSVRPLDALGARPRKRRHGMAAAFAAGFGAFVAVEVWGASLMHSFIPSKEWPDAIVSLLPGGADPLSRPDLEGLPGVARISELYPLQLPFEPEMPMKAPGAAKAGEGKGNGGNVRAPGPVRMAVRGPMLRNVLFLGAEWLPQFKFCEGTREEAREAVFSGNSCVVASMLARAHGLHKGDVLRVASGGGRRGPKTVREVPIAGVVDLNWHMVTSRGLLRGLNGSPPMTDGPAFVSLETANALDPRPFLASVPMTHLWLDYEPEFLREKGVFPAGREVEASIAAALGDPTECTVRLHARDEVADGTVAHGGDVIGQAARVPFAFLAVLSLGFIAMLAADADAGRREMAVLRAVGATRSQLAWRLASGALKTAFWGMAAGVPAGTAAGWLFTIKTASVWPGLPHPLVVPWRLLLEGAAGAVVFALAVSVPTGLFLVSRAIRSGEGFR